MNEQLFFAARQLINHQNSQVHNTLPSSQKIFNLVLRSSVVVTTQYFRKVRHSIRLECIISTRGIEKWRTNERYLRISKNFFFKQILEFLSSTQPNSSQQETLVLYRQKAIQRYKEKKYKRTANQISYACRKVVADSRPRFKGKFISKQEQEHIQQIYGGQINSILDDKRNINLKVFLNQAKLFSNTKICIKKINKGTLQNIFEKKNKLQQEIIQRIAKKEQIFQIQTN